MTVTATFQPSTISSAPGNAAALTLLLHNDAEAEEVGKDSIIDMILEQVSS